MHGIAIRKQGVAAGTGVVTLYPEAPDYSRGQNAIAAWMGVGAYDKFLITTDDDDPGGTAFAGTVELQGNNGDPTNADHWYTMAALTDGDQAELAEQAVQFVRVNCTAHTQGSATVHLTCEG